MRMICLYGVCTEAVNHHRTAVLGRTRVYLGAPCVFRVKGASLGVNSVALRAADLAGLTPRDPFEQDNPGWHSRPVGWGICTWRTEDSEALRRSLQLRPLILFFFSFCMCFTFKSKQMRITCIKTRARTIWALSFYMFPDEVKLEHQSILESLSNFS